MRSHHEILNTLKTLNFEETKSNKKTTYLNIPCGFDIETTSYKNSDGDKFAFMYIWMLGIGHNTPIYYGRTWEEFKQCIDKITQYFDTSKNRRLVIYVHNLGYEFQFMRKYFEWDNVFSVAERKPIRALTTTGIEFRCSYTLSGFSLANTAKNLTSHKIPKMEGDLDYTLIRHYQTPLTHEEKQYCINDIRIVTAYISEQIEICGGIDKIPMTNTGRVRTYVRNYCYYKTQSDTKAGKGQYTRYRKVMDDLTINPKTYKMLKSAFMGGFTHSNANYSGQILTDVSSIDFTSSYPAVMISEKFPMSEFKPYKIESTEKFNYLLNNYCVVFNAKFTNLEQKITQESYLSESKCHTLTKPIINNGRIFSANELTTTLTEIDLDIMKQVYKWESLEITNVLYAHKGYLPKPIIYSILKLYQDKTTLKDVAGSEVEYMLSKGMLNSIYGMCVTDIAKDEALYTNDEWQLEQVNLDEVIEKYNQSKNRFLFYGWGLYVTAYARKNLWSGIIAVGDDYVYSDTDSLKIFNYEKHKKYIKWYDNQLIKKMVRMCNHYKFDKKLLDPETKNGVKKMMGVWDFEGTYSRFKTLGAKRYLTEENGKLSLTVAGLSKRNGLDYMLKICDNDNLKVFNIFNDNLYIPQNETGKMTHTYIDSEHELLITDYLGVKRHVNTKSGIHLEPCDFTLSINDQYLKFIKQFSKGYFYKGVKYE